VLDVSGELFPVLRALTALLDLPDADCVRAASSAVVERSALLRSALAGRELFSRLGPDATTLPVFLLAVSAAFRRDLLLLQDGRAQRVGWGFDGSLLVLCAVGQALCAVRGLFRADSPPAPLSQLLGSVAEDPAHAKEIQARERLACSWKRDLPWISVAAATDASAPVPPSSARVKEPSKRREESASRPPAAPKRS
jgi:hypothetical protein